MASQENNIYFYEPIRALNASLHNEDLIKQELVQYYHCNIRQSMLNIGTRPSINVKHKYVFGKHKNDLSLLKLTELCLQEPLIIIKTIRTRLRWARDLMDRPDLNLKVVHLVRDPRGTHISMEKVEWNIDYKNKCDIVLEVGPTLCFNYDTFAQYSFYFSSECGRTLKTVTTVMHSNKGEDNAPPTASRD